MKKRKKIKKPNSDGLNHGSNMKMEVNIENVVKKEMRNRNNRRN